MYLFEFKMFCLDDNKPFYLVEKLTNIHSKLGTVSETDRARTCGKSDEQRLRQFSGCARLDGHRFDLHWQLFCSVDLGCLRHLLDAIITRLHQDFTNLEESAPRDSETSEALGPGAAHCDEELAKRS